MAPKKNNDKDADKDKKKQEKKAEKKKEKADKNCAASSGGNEAASSSGGVKRRLSTDADLSSDKYKEKYMKVKVHEKLMAKQKKKVRRAKQAAHELRKAVAMNGKMAQNAGSCQKQAGSTIEQMAIASSAGAAVEANTTSSDSDSSSSDDEIKVIVYMFSYCTHVELFDASRPPSLIV